MPDPGSSAASDAAHDTTHFGFEDVLVSEKAARVRDVFSSVAGNYDLMNDLMSMGVHRAWKAAFVKKIMVRPGMKFLDVAGGTGDIAFRLREKTGNSGEITVCDINPDMLRVGQARAIDRGILGPNSGLRWVCGNAEAVPAPTPPMTSIRSPSGCAT